MIPQFTSLNAKERRNAILFMESENKQFGPVLQLVPPKAYAGQRWAPLKVWRSAEFFVQEFPPTHDGVIRLSVNRTHVDPTSLRWVDGISWDDLQRLKGEAGYADREAVEVYPPAACVVNEANIRHLWILPARMPFSWGP